MTSRQRQRRLRLHPHRGHRIRQATGHVERRLHRRLGPRHGGAANPLTMSTNGRIYKMVLDPNGTGNPTEAEISILVQGDDVGDGSPQIPANSLNEIHQPDNLETTATATCSSRRTRARPTSTTFRATRTGHPGEALEGTAQWSRSRGLEGAAARGEPGARRERRIRLSERSTWTRSRRQARSLGVERHR